MGKKQVKLLFIAALLAVFASGAGAYDDRHIKVSLISEHSSLQPGTTHWLGVLFEPEHHWHVYWQNPGDSGLAPKIEFILPEGVTAGEIHWPAPEQIPTEQLMNYGYHRVLLMVPITVDQSVVLGQTLTLKAKTSWLVCREECIPGRAQLALNLPVAEHSKASAAAKEFAEARKQLPAKYSGQASYQINDEQVVLVVFKDTAGYPSQPIVYPVTADLVNYAQLPIIQRDGKRLEARFALSDYFSEAPPHFDFVVKFGPEAIYRVSAPKR